MNPEMKQLRDKLKGLKLDGMIVSNPANVRYLTGLDAEGYLIITPKENVFITDGRFIEQVNHYLTIDSEIVCVELKTLTPYDYKSYFEGCENVGFEERYVTYENYKNYLQTYQINLIETEGIVESQRIVKEEYEIEKIKRACEITDKAFEFTINNIKRGMTEKELAFELNYQMIKNGAEGFAFETIVASGPNSSMPHAVPTDRKIEENDIVLFDFGAKYNGYCSDCSRTIFIGNVTQKQRKYYEFVLEEQKKAIENFKDETNLKTIVKNRETDYRLENLSLIHALGHGVGLEIHEEPFLRSTVDYILKKDTIIAIEPGVYFPGEFGIRIEDTCRVTKDRCETLTNSKKDLKIVKLK